MSITVTETEIGYSETEIGRIPEDWEVKTLKEFADLKNGYAFSSQYFSTEGPIVITPGNFKLNGGLDFKQTKKLHYVGNYQDYMQLKIGDLVVVMTDLTPDCNLLGKSGIINGNEKILHNQRIGKIVLSETVSRKFLMYFFNSIFFSNRMKSTATGSTVRHTSKPTILNSKLPIPPYSEQQAIATALEDTDLWISGLERLISKKKAIKQGAMQELLTGRRRLKDENGKPFEGEWEERKLGEIVKLAKSGGTPLSSNKAFYDGKIPFLSIADMTSQGKYIHYTSNFISQKGLENSTSWIVPLNSIIYSMYASVGFVSISKIELATSQAVLNLILKNSYVVEFVFYYLVSLQSSVSKFVGEGTQKNLNAQTVKEFTIKLPSFREQTAIATVLGDVDREIDVLEAKLEKALQIKQGMMQELLTGRVRLV